MPSLLPPAVPPGLGSQAQPELVVDDLVLRPWSPTDARDVSVAYDDPDIRRWHGRSMTLAEARDWIAAAHLGWSEDSLVSWAVTSERGLAARLTLRLHLVDG